MFDWPNITQSYLLHLFNIRHFHTIFFNDYIPVRVLTSLAASRSQILRAPDSLPAHTSSSVWPNLNIIWWVPLSILRVLSTTLDSWLVPALFITRTTKKIYMNGTFWIHFKKITSSSVCGQTYTHCIYIYIVHICIYVSVSDTTILPRLKMSFPTW